METAHCEQFRNALFLAFECVSMPLLAYDTLSASCRRIF